MLSCIDLVQLGVCVTDVTAVKIDENTARGAATNPTILRGFAAIAILLGAQVLGGLVGGVAEGVSATRATSMEELDVVNVAIFGWSFGVALPILWIWMNIRSFGVPFAQAIGLRPISVSNRTVILYSAVGLIAVYGFALLHQIYVVGEDSAVGSAEELFAYARIDGTTTQMVLCAFFIVLAVPIVEELVFRGYLQSALSKYWPAWASITFVSAIFATVHGTFVLWPVYFAMGLFLGFMFYKMGSIKVSIAIHMLNNLVVLVVLMLSDAA